MPGMSGRDLAEKLIPDHPETRVLFMSGYPADIIAQREILPKGTNFMSKPFTIDTLSQKVREALR